MKLTGLVVTTGMITLMFLGSPTALAGESFEQIVAGAKKEGKVVFFESQPDKAWIKLMKAFQKKYRQFLDLFENYILEDNSWFSKKVHNLDEIKAIRIIIKVSNGFIAGIVGVVIAHVIADYIAASLDPDIRSAALGIVLGGLAPLILIPFLEKYVTKSQHHIAIGDHEDLKKDLEKKHN